jgi:LysM repeat protein
MATTTDNLTPVRLNSFFPMKIIKILGIAAGVHALALILLLSSPGCSSSKAAPTDASPISAAPGTDTSAPSPSATVQMPDSVGIRYSPTRPGTTVASALEKEPVSDVTPASTYTVARGDNLSSIAKKNQLTKAELASANGLKAGSILHVGQKLIIPSKAGQPKAAVAEQPAPKAADGAALPEKLPADATKHVVKPGETLGGIARRYNVKQGDIAVANNITDPKKIQPGQELVIPTKSTTATAKQPKAAAPAKAATAPADEDLDAGLKTPSATEVPVIKIDDSGAQAQPKNP